MIPAAGCDYRQPGALNPSVGVRRQLPLHKGAVFAARHTTGHPEWITKNSPDGGVFLLLSQFYHPARKRSLAVPTRDRRKRKVSVRDKYW